MRPARRTYHSRLLCHRALTRTWAALYAAIAQRVGLAQRRAYWRALFAPKPLSSYYAGIADSCTPWR